MYVWNKWAERLGRVDRETPKMFFVRVVVFRRDGTMEEFSSARWPKDQRCLRIVAEKSVQRIRELEDLDRHYREKYHALNEEHRAYRKPILDAIAAEAQPQEKL